MENNFEERQVEQVELCGLEDFKISLEADPELGVEAIEKSVVAKQYTNKTVFIGLLRSILGRKWKLAKGWKLQEVEPKTFIIRLTKKQEALQISRNGPWPICDGFLVVKPMPDDGKWSSADLNSSPVWVRVYEMPPRYWTIKNANALAQKIGSVISIDRLWRNGFPTNEYVRFQERLERELRDVRFQAEARDNLIPGGENFEPALIGTDLHMEAVIEVARRQKEAESEIGGSSKSPVEGSVVEGSPSSLEI
ncbi:hypothetical protein G4B88_029892 [Cannabis sativa]|nr:hypothetical protein G4B88_029892 [Cannabis sativa]